MPAKAFKGKRAMMKANFRSHGGGAGSWPAAGECEAFVRHGQGDSRLLTSEMMLAAASTNSTLLRYLYPSSEPTSVTAGWRAFTSGCRIVPSGCWCFHVAGGSMVKADNPRGAEHCAPKDRVLDCTDPAAGPFRIKAQRNCSCFSQAPAAPPCLFGDMRPAKLLAIIAACRSAGVTHIIEQGRYGGLSAYIYALHGFKVTSIELLPLSEVGAAMASLAPQVKLVDADGRAAVVAAVREAPPSERLAVIFDGEKRQTAYTTFGLVKPRVALAAFDDSNLDDGAFPRMLQASGTDAAAAVPPSKASDPQPAHTRALLPLTQDHGEAAWHTWDCAFMRAHADAVPLKQLDSYLRAAAASLLATGVLHPRVSPASPPRLRRPRASPLISAGASAAPLTSARSSPLTSPRSPPLAHLRSLISAHLRRCERRRRPAPAEGAGRSCREGDLPWGHGGPRALPHHPRPRWRAVGVRSTSAHMAWHETLMLRYTRELCTREASRVHMHKP